VRSGPNRNDPRVLLKTTAYGWVESGWRLIKSDRVSVKVPDFPHSDTATTRSRVRSGSGLCGDWRTQIDDLVRRDERVNGEFYLDSVPNGLIGSGREVRVFEVDKYIGWGDAA